MSLGFPLIGCEIELPLLPRDPEVYRKDIPAIWEEVVQVLGGTWHVDIDALTGGVVGASQGGDYRNSALSYDASVLLLEFSLAPQKDLQALEAEWQRISKPVLGVFARHGVRALGCGMQPEIDIDAPNAYKTWCTPKGLYWYLKKRGWDHRWNLRCASSQPSVDVTIDEAMDAVNFLERILPLCQPFLAHSCIERWTADPDIAEKRDLVGWSKLMEHSVDIAMIGMPPLPYKDLNGYMRRVFGHPLHTVTFDSGAATKKSRGVWLTEQPSLLQLLEKLQWEGLQSNGDTIMIETEKLDPDTTACIDWYVFHSARLRMRLKPIGSWDVLRNAIKTDPSSLIAKTFIEVRSIATQLPAEPLLPAALCLGLLRARPQLEKWLGQWTWDQIRDFSRTKAFRFDAWTSSVGSVSYTTIAMEIVRVMMAALTPDEQKFLGALSDRVSRDSSPASLSSEALKKSRDAFLSLVTYPQS